MDLLKPIKTLFKRGKKKVEDYFDTQAMVIESTKLREEFELAKNEKRAWDKKADREEQIYMGDREFGNIYSDNTQNDARTVVRLSQTFIEAQIDLSIPDAVFKPVAKDDEVAVKKLQAEVDYTLRSSNLTEINALSEREVKKYGWTVYKVLWDNNYRGAGFRGRPEIISVHPKNILWASGTTDKNKCRCWYHVENETLQECIKRYGDIAKKLPTMGERADIEYDKVGTKYSSNVNKTNDVTQNPDVYSRPFDSPLAKYTIIEKWYLDDDDECCLKVFSNNLILLDKPKFYHRRKYDADAEQYEIDEKGNEVLLSEESMFSDYNSIPAGENVPLYYPRGPQSMPIIIQNNIPRSKAIPGISDIERTYDFEQSMKKVLHKHEERILKGNTKILYNKQQEEEAAQMLDNDDLNVIPVNEVNNFKMFDIKADDSTTLNFFEFLLNHSQYQMGITQSWQGMQQGEAKSGKAIQSLVNQTAEKISIKVNEKNIAYKRIYRLLCDFILCFSDGDRPYRLDNNFTPEYGIFNRYDMLRKDASGNWLYPDFDIEISAESGFPRTKQFIFESVIQLAQGQFFEPTPTNKLVWTLLSKVGFPNAEGILESIETQIDTQPTDNLTEESTPTEESTDPTVDQIINMLPNEMKSAFMALPDSEKARLLGG